MDEQQFQEKLAEWQRRYLPGEWEEKPTFAKDDRVMLTRDLPPYAVLSGVVPEAPLKRGTKGYIFALDAGFVFFPVAVRFETHTMWLCSFEMLERYCAKAVGNG